MRGVSRREVEERDTSQIRVRSFSEHCRKEESVSVRVAGLSIPVNTRCRLIPKV